MKKLIKEFMAFIKRGNVVDLAVAVVIGSAFTAIVNSFAQDVIMPLITLAMGSKTLEGQCLVLNGVPKYVTDASGVKSLNPEAITWNYGNFMQAILSFLIIALFLFVLLKTVARVKKTMDVRAMLQEKLDQDKPLTKTESKLLAKWEKRDPETAPKKKVPEPEAPAAPTEAELLARLCELVEENNRLQQGK